jgi:outer membrane protein assembly factor BamB
MRPNHSRLFLVTLLFSLCTTASQAENWPHWRGPTFDGISKEKGLPVEWSKDKNVAWKVALPGPAGASPVVWGENIFVTSVDGEDLVLFCIGTNGKQKWRRVVGKGNKKSRGDEGNSASPSPTTDGKHVWSMMGNGDISCFDMDGKEVWKTHLPDRYGKFKIAFGMSSSPIHHDGRLYIQLIHGDGKAETQEAMVVALNAVTGEEVWKRDRVTGASNENEHSYASPILYNYDGETFLLSHGADYTIAHRLNDGSEIFRLEGLNPRKGGTKDYHRTLRFVSSPGVAPGLIIVPTAKNYPTFALRTDGKGSIATSSKSVLWQYSKTPDVPTPVIQNGLVYLCMANGNLHCLDAKSGAEIYAERTNRIRHRSSPVLADGKIYLTGRDGKVTVVKTGKKFEVLAVNEIGDDTSASPAFSNGTIYIRSFGSLWAIRGK